MTTKQYKVLKFEDIESIGNTELSVFSNKEIN